MSEQLQSWQPRLLYEFIEDFRTLLAEAACERLDVQSVVGSYLLGDRGWQLLHLLAHTHWPDGQSVIGAFSHERVTEKVLHPLLDCLVLMCGEDMHEYEQCLLHLIEYEFVSDAEVCAVASGSQSCGASLYSRCLLRQPCAHKPARHRGRRQPSQQLAAKMSQDSEDETTLAPSLLVNQKTNTVRVYRPSRLMPRCVQVDGDGIPMGWGDAVPASGQPIGDWSLCALDDTQLGWLFEQLPRPILVWAEQRSSAVVIALLCQLIQRALLMITQMHNARSGEPSDAVVQAVGLVVDVVLDWLEDHMQDLLQVVRSNAMHTADPLSMYRVQWLQMSTAQGHQLLFMCCRLRLLYEQHTLSDCVVKAVNQSLTHAQQFAGAVPELYKIDIDRVRECARVQLYCATRLLHRTALLLTDFTADLQHTPADRLYSRIQSSVRLIGAIDSSGYGGSLSVVQQQQQDIGDDWRGQHTLLQHSLHCWLAVARRMHTLRQLYAHTSQCYMEVHTKCHLLASPAPLAEHDKILISGFTGSCACSCLVSWLLSCGEPAERLLSRAQLCPCPTCVQLLRQCLANDDTLPVKRSPDRLLLLALDAYDAYARFHQDMPALVAAMWDVSTVAQVSALSTAQQPALLNRQHRFMRIALRCLSADGLSSQLQSHLIPRLESQMAGLCATDSSSGDEQPTRDALCWTAAALYRLRQLNADVVGCYERITQSLTSDRLDACLSNSEPETAAAIVQLVTQCCLCEPLADNALLAAWLLNRYRNVGRLILEDSANLLAHDSYWPQCTLLLTAVLTCLQSHSNAFSQQILQQAESDCVQISLVRVCISALTGAQPAHTHKAAALLGIAIRLALATAAAHKHKDQLLQLLEECLLSEAVLESTAVYHVCCVLVECSTLYVQHDYQWLDSDEPSPASYISTNGEGSLADDEQPSKRPQQQPATVADGCCSQDDQLVLCHEQLLVLMLNVLTKVSQHQSRDEYQLGVCLRALGRLCRSEGNVLLLDQHGIGKQLHALCEQLCLTDALSPTIIRMAFNLLAHLLSVKPSTDDLAQLLRLAKQANKHRSIVFECLVRVLPSSATPAPRYWLVFPQTMPPSSPTIESPIVEHHPAGIKRARSSSNTPRKQLHRSNVRQGNGSTQPLTNSLFVGAGGSHSQSQQRLGHSVTLDNNIEMQIDDAATLPRRSSGLLRSLSNFLSGSQVRMAEPAGSRSPGAKPAHKHRVSQQHTQAALRVCVSDASVSVRAGVSVGVWCAVQHTSVQHNSALHWMHLVSIESDDLCMSVYVHAHSNQLQLRVFNQLQVLHEHTINCSQQSALSQWSHVVLCAQVHNTDVCRLTLYTNGRQCSQLDLPWSVEGTGLDEQSCSIALGCVRGDNTAAKLLTGNLMLFRTVLPQLPCLLLYAFGADCATVAESASRSLMACVPHLLSAQVLSQCQPQVDALLTDQQATVNLLQSSHVLSFTPAHPTVVSIYEPAAAGSAFSALECRVVSRSVEWRTLPVCTHQASMHHSLITLGGTKLLFILLAIVIEQESSESTQCLALRLFLRTVNTHAELRRQFYKQFGCTLVTKLLQSAHVHMGAPLMHEMCTACIEGVEPLLHHAQFHSLIEACNVSQPVDAADCAHCGIDAGDVCESVERQLIQPAASQRYIITDPHMLVQMVTDALLCKKHAQNWYWWHYLLCVLCHCVAQTPGNVYAAFNVSQLQRVDLLVRLLHVLYDVGQQSSEFVSQQIPRATSKYIIFLINVCVSHENNPKAVEQLSELWDFLFLTHPAACTYLNYRIGGHNDWMQQAVLNEQPVNLLKFDSPFVGLLKRYANVLGAQRIRQLMADTDASVSAVRRAYAERMGTSQMASYSYPVSGLAVSRKLQAVSGRHNTVQSGTTSQAELDRQGSSITSASYDHELSSSSVTSETSEELLDVHIGFAPVASSSRRAAAADSLLQSAADLLPTADANSLGTTAEGDSGTAGAALPDLICDVPSGANANDNATTTDSEFVDDVDSWAAVSASAGGLSSPNQLANSAATDDSHYEKLLSVNAFSAAGWLVDVRAGLLQLLAHVLQTAPDRLTTSLCQTINWQCVLVLLNHQPNQSVRVACVRALCALLMQLDDMQRIKFLKCSGFTLLANQLREFPSSADMADCLLSMLCGEPVRLNNGLDATHLQTLAVDRFQCGALEAILPTFVNCTHDTTLFCNVANAIKKMFEHNMVLEQALLDKHLVECLVSGLVRLARLHNANADNANLEQVEERTLMIECWHALAVRVLQTCLVYTDMIHHQACIDMISLLILADVQMSAEADGQNSAGHTIIRRELCLLLLIWLETIKALYSGDMCSASRQQSVDSMMTAIARSHRSTPYTSGQTTPRSAVSGSHSSLIESRITFDSNTLQSASNQPMASYIQQSSLSNLRHKLAGLSMNSSQLSIKGLYKLNQGGHQIASHSELVERLKLGLQYCSDVCVHLAISECDEEEHLFEYYFYFLLGMARADINREQAKRRRQTGSTAASRSWTRLLVSCREKHKQLLAHALAFILFPARHRLLAVGQTGNASRSEPFPQLPTTASNTELAEEATENGNSGWTETATGCIEQLALSRRRHTIAKALAHEMHYKVIIKHVLDLNIDYQYAMNLALHDLQLNESLLSSAQQQHNWRHDADKLIRYLRHLKIYSPLLQLDDSHVRNVSTDEQLCIQTYQDTRQVWLQRLRNAINRLCLAQQNTNDPVRDSAMSVTCAVVEEQNVPRRVFIQRTKHALAQTVRAEEGIRAMLSDLSHPAALCYDVTWWPQSWGLDPTEGPNRERRRLMPRPLGIAARFLLPEAQHKAEPLHSYKPPLSSMITQSFGTSVYPAVRSRCVGMSLPDGDDEAAQAAQLRELTAQLLDRLRINEHVAYSSPATILRSTIECSGDVVLGASNIYFIGDSSRTTQKGLPEASLMSMSWSYSTVSEVYKRHHQLQDVACEIFFSDGETFLICFENVTNRNEFLQRLMTQDLSNLTVYADNLLHATTQWWREGLITNFEYLMHLNKLAGRTFSDLMQYPVFPFVLADYTSYTLDLNNPNVFRNLAKPIAIQNKKMEDHYLKVYKCLEEDMRRAPRAARENNMLGTLGPYHYGSHYSNSGCVIHYLVRVPPFTTMALEYQDDNFDIADRLFSSMEVTWRLSSCDSTTDFKELIPEFFFFPEMFVNTEQLDLGVRQNGARVNDVILPEWVPNQDPRLFVLIHRQALESQQVTSFLHQWIDLVFGYKQTGQQARDAINCFHPATYHQTQTLIGQQHDELQMAALRTMVRTYGQMPKQLFRTPHLAHLHAKPNMFAVPNRTMINSPIASVQGIRWGIYVGSPETADPILVLKQRATLAAGGEQPLVRSLFALPDGACVGLAERCTLMAPFRATKSDMVTPWNVREVDSLSLLSWSFADSVVRARVLSPEPRSQWLSLITLHDHKVECAAFTPITNRVFIGLDSGLIRVYNVAISNTLIGGCSLVKELIGHTAAVTCLDVCHEFSVIVSGCANGAVYVWDLNRLSFVRALPSHASAVTHVLVGRTSCDLLSVSQSGYGSLCSVYTCNGGLVGHIESDIVVCAVAMTAVPEGTAVNAIALAMQNGVIRLYDTWTLSHIRDISHQSFLEPIVSICFAQQDRKLYVCTASGAVLCWQCVHAKHTRPPRFIFAHPSM